jgi:hypothetical protein
MVRFDFVPSTSPEKVDQIQLMVDPRLWMDPLELACVVHT